MIRLLSALALILSLSAVIQADFDPVSAMIWAAVMGQGNSNNNNNNYNRACLNVRCGRGFQCVGVRDNNYERPSCVLTNVNCRDLVGDDNGWNRNNYYGDEPQPNTTETTAGQRRRQLSPQTCRRDYDCQRQQNNNNYAQVYAYKCCPLDGGYENTCVSVPSYTPDSSN